MNNAKLVMTPIRRGLLAGKENTIDVLVSIEAPDAPVDLQKNRPALNLALVVDRSGSMAGAPLAEAKRCAAHVVERLSAQDRIAIVAYDDEAAVIVPSQLAVDSQSVCARINAIQDRGCTNLHGGWLTGAGEVSPFVKPASVSRVMLLSDGLANRGLLDRVEIYRQCEELAGAGVTTSTYGLGSQFDEELMTGIARAGQGNAYYGNTAQDLFDPIEEELQLLSALFARQLRVRYQAARGVRVRVVNSLTRPAPGEVVLPDLAFDGEAWVLLRLEVPAGASTEPAPALVNLLEVSAEFEFMDGARGSLDPVTLALPSLAEQDYRALAEEPRVRTRAAELDVARIEREAREAARRGDWNQVDRSLDMACMVASDSDWASETVADLRQIARERDAERLSKESHYAAHRQERRLSPKPGAGPVDSSRARYLREKSLQGRSDN